MSAEQLRLMAVHAHPDDESSKGAATMARYVDEGVDVLVVTCTGGERGSILNPALQHRAGHRGEHRRDPARRDGPRPRDPRRRQHWLGFVDSGLPEGDPLPPLPEGCFALAPVEEATRRLVARDPPVPAARDDDLRRERRLPAPRPHPLPRDLASRRSRPRRTPTRSPTRASRGSR